MSSAVFELSDLDGGNGFVLNGIDAWSFSGRSVSSADDVNGDGCQAMIRIAGTASCSGGSFGECGFQTDSE